MVYFTLPYNAHITSLKSRNDDEISKDQSEGNNNSYESHEYTQAPITMCSICGSNQIITDTESGEMICSRCGQVISDKISETRPEWRNFPESSGSSNDRSRTGMSTSLARHDMGLSTIIGRTDKDAAGQKIDTATRSTMDRLRTWDYRIQNYRSTDKNLQQAFHQLNTLKDKLGLSDLALEKSAYIYRKAQGRGFSRGRTIRVVLAAAVYIACRQIGISRTLKDIAAISDVRYKSLTKTYRHLILELDFKVPNADPMKCIVKVANKANLSEKTKRKAMTIMNDVTNNGISAGKDPMALAAAVLYISSIKTEENINQGCISGAAGVTTVTIRNRFKDLKHRLDLNN
jgi:transcription initiation factor TFIIB